MFIHDLIKIKLVDEGYLPNIPYHLISTEEMCNAFMSPGNGGMLKGYFIDNYPAYSGNSEDITESYENLVLTIYCYIQLYILYEKDNKLHSNDPEKIPFTIPDWIYSYMLGAVISVNSDKRDIHDLILPMGVDNIDDDFNDICMAACYRESFKRIKQLNLCSSISLPSYTSEKTNILQNAYIPDSGDHPKSLNTIYSTAYTISDIWNSGISDIVKSANNVLTRPPAMFGEPHIIKSIRLQQAGGR